MAIDSIKNFGQGTVLGSHNSTDYTITLVSGHGANFPLPPGENAFNVVWWEYSSYLNPADDPNKELVRVTTRVGDVLILANNGVARTAQESTVASTKNNSGSVYKVALVITKKMIDDIFDHVSNAATLPEDLSSQCDGATTIFTTSDTIEGIFWVSLNGGMLIEGLDFTITGTSEITITTVTPESGEKLYIKYF